MVLLLLTFCLLLLPLWESVIVLCFVVRYFMSILVLQSSWWGRESWLLYLICLPGVLWWLGVSSSRCHGVVCSLWLWYFLIILTYYFCSKVPLNLTFWKYFQQIKLSILPSCCSCQPMISMPNLSTHVFVTIIKSQEKIKPVKWSFLNFNLNGQKISECKNQDFM